MLGLAVGGPTPNQDMMFYRQKLNSELMMEHKLKDEIKTLEYKKMWDDVNVDDPANKWVKNNKTDSRLGKAKTDLSLTKKKIKVLKQIVEKDSLDKVVPQTQVL